MEEASPLEAGLLTADPEHRGDSYDQHHQILDQEQGKIGAAGALDLQETHTQREREREKGYQLESGDLCVMERADQSHEYVW